MIYFDVTKSGDASHRSGLTRVNERLRSELGSAAVPVYWRSGLVQEGGAPVEPRGDDWFLTTELFSGSERPGFPEWIERRACRRAAVFHDAIPVQLPHITWPRSVERHPAYMKALAGFDRVFAVSAATRDELIGFWRWQGIASLPPVDVLPLGADFDSEPRAPCSMPHASAADAPAALLCVGIIEPRKNQAFLVQVCQALWREGLQFELHIVGRTNPHFGAEIAADIKRAQRKNPSLHFHGPAADAKLAKLYAGARATVLPTIAEGCGLPLLESLWRGIPCICSDLPSLRENAREGGCVVVPVNDAGAWAGAIRGIVTGENLASLQSAASSRPLPTWSACAGQILAALGGRNP